MKATARQSCVWNPNAKNNEPIDAEAHHHLDDIPFIHTSQELENTPLTDQNHRTTNLADMIQQAVNRHTLNESFFLS